MKIVLASGSPRRKELMEMLGVEELEIIPAKGEEKPMPGAGPEQLVSALSAAKAREVAENCDRDAVVVAADTIVWHNGGVFGKPRDKAMAAEMLHALSGRTHEVYTGVTVIKNGTAHTRTKCTRVTFRSLSDREIDAYIATREPMDKAGAYGAQGKAALFVEKIDGDFFNVMGLPLCLLGKMLKEQGVELL